MVKNTKPTTNTLTGNAPAMSATAGNADTFGATEGAVPNGAMHPDASGDPTARGTALTEDNRNDRNDRNPTRPIGASSPHGGTSGGTSPLTIEEVRKAVLACLRLDPDQADAVMRALSERPDPDAAFETLFPILASRLDRDGEFEDARRECAAFAVSQALELARAVRRAGPATLVRDTGPGWDLCTRLNDAHERLGVLADRGNATAAVVLDYIAPVVAECHAHAMDAAGVAKAEAAGATGVGPGQADALDTQAAHSAKGSTRSGAANAPNMRGGVATVLRLVTGEDRS